MRLAAGKYSATIYAYDAVGCGATSCIIPPTAKLLSAVNGARFAVKHGKLNTLHVTLAGMVASLLITGFNVYALGPDGDLIVGSYDNPITMSSSNAAVTIATSPMI